MVEDPVEELQRMSQVIAGFGNSILPNNVVVMVVVAGSDGGSLSIAITSSGTPEVTEKLLQAVSRTQVQPQTKGTMH